jgi:hypothetical protein
VDESLSRYARERRAAHAKGKLLMDHGVLAEMPDSIA